MFTRARISWTQDGLTKGMKVGGQMASKEFGHLPRRVLCQGSLD